MRWSPRPGCTPPPKTSAPGRPPAGWPSGSAGPPPTSPGSCVRAAPGPAATRSRSSSPRWNSSSAGPHRNGTLGEVGQGRDRVDGPDSGPRRKTRGRIDRGRRASAFLVPAMAQGVRAGLRTAVPGEDALLVAVDPGDARAGGEVGEVPDLLADDGVDPVEDPVIHRQQLDLELLAPRVADQAVQPGLGVGAVLGHHDGLAAPRPLAQLGLEHTF